MCSWKTLADWFAFCTLILKSYVKNYWDEFLLLFFFTKHQKNYPFSQIFDCTDFGKYLLYSQYGTLTLLRERSEEESNVYSLDLSLGKGEYVFARLHIQLAHSRYRIQNTWICNEKRAAAMASKSCTHTQKKRNTCDLRD